MSDEKTFEIGEIVKWKGSSIEEEWGYGIVLEPENLITYGTYSYSAENEVVDPYYSLANLPIVEVTLYCFKTQRTVKIYRSPEEIPFLIKKIDFSQKSS